VRTTEEKRIARRKAYQKWYWSHHEHAKAKSREAAKKSYWNNLGRVREYYRQNKKRICDQAKRWKQNNPERFKELHKLSRDRNPEKVRQRWTNYHRVHKERIKQNHLAWKNKNRSRIRALDSIRKKYRRSVTIGDLTEIAKIYERRDWWRKWDKDYIPELYHVIQSYDTAFLKKETADFSAITTWGVFYPNPDSGPNLILLDAQ